jgi:hypothetical protein
VSATAPGERVSTDVEAVLPFAVGASRHVSSHADSSSCCRRAVTTYTRRNLERYIRGEPVLSERGEPIDGYVAAWDDLQKKIMHQIEETDVIGDGEKA